MKVPSIKRPVVWILCLYLAAAGALPAGFACAEASCDQPRWVTECYLPDFGAPELTPGCGCPAAEAEPCRLRQDNTSPATLRLNQLRAEKRSSGTPSLPSIPAGLVHPLPPFRKGAAAPAFTAPREAPAPLFLQHGALLC